MHQEELEAFVASEMAEGQHQLANILRALVWKADAELIELLRLEDDDTFLEPLLFAFFNTKEPQVTLPQILFGYIEDRLKPPAIDVFADSHGTVYLPKIGYFRTLRPNRGLSLSWDGQSRMFGLTESGEQVGYDFTKIVTVEGTAIEICQGDQALLSQFFRSQDNGPTRVDVEDVTRAQTENLNKAFSKLRCYCPSCYANVVAVTRKILIYASLHPYSFATMSAHGIAFLNAADRGNPVFFLEDIIHQCSHIVFNAVTLEKGDYLDVDPDTPLSQFTNADVAGSVYAAFHGLFTQANINRCLQTCHEAGAFSGVQKHELEGRISDDMKRFRSALAILGRRELYSERGWWLFNHFRYAFELLYARQRQLIEKYDTSNQDYIFSYPRFMELNPYV